MRTLARLWCNRKEMIDYPLRTSDCPLLLLHASNGNQDTLVSDKTRTSRSAFLEMRHEDPYHERGEEAET